MDELNRVSQLTRLWPALLILALLTAAAFCFAAGGTGWITAGAIATAYALWGAVMWHGHRKTLNDHERKDDDERHG